MKVLILCGGNGIRLQNSNEFIPKAMIRIGYKPMIWHVMKIFSKFGINDFVLALGSGGDLIRDFFLNYNNYQNDITVSLTKSSTIIYSSAHMETNWNVTMVDTGEKAGTGARVFRCKKYLDDGDFMVSYVDCLSDINLNNLLTFHSSHNKTATVTGVFPPFRYGEFVIKEDVPISYNPVSRMQGEKGLINGGFMVLRPKIFDYLSVFNECMMETEIFTEMVVSNDLRVFIHDGLWQCLDNDREFIYLNNLCLNNKEFWLYDK